MCKIGRVIMRADKNNIKQNKKNNKFLKLTNIEVETINGGGFWSEVWEGYKKRPINFFVINRFKN